MSNIKLIINLETRFKEMGDYLCAVSDSVHFNRIYYTGTMRLCELTCFDIPYINTCGFRVSRIIPASVDCFIVYFALR